MHTKINKREITNIAKGILEYLNGTEDVEAVLICRNSSVFAFTNEEECKQLCCSKDGKIYLNDKKSIFVKDKRFDLFNLDKYWSNRIGIIIWRNGTIETVDETRTLYNISEKEIIGAKSIEDFYSICNDSYHFEPYKINYFLKMLNNITKKDSIKKAKEFMAFLEAGSFWGYCPGDQFAGFSLPSRKDIRVTDRNSYSLNSEANYIYDFYEDIEKMTIKVVFDGTKWYIKSTRVVKSEAYRAGKQYIRSVYWY